MDSIEQFQLDEQFMREALAEARAAAAEGEVPIGAVVVYDGKVIARAHNRRELDEDPSAHAEFSAMLKASRALGRWRLTGCTVYVTLEPCVMCSGLMVNARIDRCVFGAPDPKGGALTSLYALGSDRRLNHEFNVVQGVLADECAQELSGFFARLRSGRGAAAAGDGTGERGASCQHDQHVAKRDAAMQVASPAGRRVTAEQEAEPAPRVLLAVDSFKGSATSAQAERWLCEGILQAFPKAQVESMLLADGGEGTVAAIANAIDGEVRETAVHDPFGRPVHAEYLFSSNGTAVVELASAASIAYSNATHDAAMRASTFGVGELVRSAVDAGATTVLLGLGGSATTDCGLGFVQALGAQALDERGEAVPAGLAGVACVRSLDLAPVRELLAGVELVALTDVDNPLVGERGAVRVYGPQKGLTDQPTPRGPKATLFDEADGWMIAFAQLLDADRAASAAVSDAPQPARKKRFRSVRGVPGAGAAGGMGAAVLTLGGRLESGIEAMLDIIGFNEAVQAADLVITGEGMIDGQTAAGKAPVGVARRAKRYGKPVVAVVGGRASSLHGVYSAGIDLVLPAVRRPMTLERAMEPSEVRRNLMCAGEAAVRAYLLR